MTVTLKPRLLDLFSGSGGAARGYQRAGFYVIGVDIRPQPLYAGDEFVQADVMSYAVGKLIDWADVVHASPPCQPYSPHVSSTDSEYAGTRGRNEPRLINAVRSMLVDSGKPYIIENVVPRKGTGDLRPNLLLCGTMFRLPISRHRLFETSLPIPQPFHPPCSGVAKRFAESRGWDPRDMTVTGKGRRSGTSERWAEIMGINWPMTQHGMREAIPPRYSTYVGAAILDEMRQAA